MVNTRQISNNQSIKINEHCKISGSDITSLEYLAEGEFGEVYSAEYTGDDETFQSQYCTQIGKQFFFVIKYDKHNNPEFKTEQDTVTAIANTQTDKSHMSLSTGAQLIDENDQILSQMIISPFAYQKMSKKGSILTRDGAKFAWHKSGLNENGKPKLAQDAGTLLLGIFLDMHKGLLQCHDAGYLHLDNAPRNYLMTKTEYDKQKNAITYHAKICDYGQSREIKNGTVTNSSKKIPILISSTNRLHGNPLTTADDLYAFRMAILEEVLLVMGCNLKSAFRGLLRENGYTSYDFKDIAQCVYDIDDDNKVLTAIYNRVLDIAKQPQSNQEMQRDRSQVILLLTHLQEYICNTSPNSATDTLRLNEAYDAYVEKALIQLNYQFHDRKVDINTIHNEMTLSVKRLAALPSKYKAKLSAVKALTNQFFADLELPQTTPQTAILPVDPAILAVAQIADANNKKAALLEQIKIANGEIKKLSEETDKETRFSRFFEMLRQFELVKNAHEELGIAVPHNIYIDRMAKHSKSFAKIYKAYQNITNGVLEIDLSRNVVISAVDRNTAIASFINALNQLIEIHDNEWTPATKHKAISQELLSAYSTLKTYNIALSPELIVEYGIQNPKAVIHNKILKHLHHIPTLKKTLENPSTQKLTFYQRHPILTWALIGAGTAVGVLAIAVAIAFTSGAAAPLIVLLAKGMIALGAAAGLNLSGFSVIALAGTAFGVAAAAMTTITSGIFAGCALGIRKIVGFIQRMNVKSEKVTVNATTQTNDVVPARTSDVISEEINNVAPERTSDVTPKEVTYIDENGKTVSSRLVEPPSWLTSPMGSSARVLAATSGYGESYKPNTGIHSQSKPTSTTGEYVTMPSTRPMPRSTPKQGAEYGGVMGSSATSHADQGGYGEGGNPSSLNSQYSNLPETDHDNQDGSDYLPQPLDPKQLGNRPAHQDYVDIDTNKDNNDNPSPRMGTTPTSF